MSSLGPRRAIVLAVLAVVAATELGGCDAATPSLSVTPTTSGASPAPSATPWPATVISSVIALGAVDAEIGKAADDLQAAAEAEDPERLLGAADGLARLVDESRPNAEALTRYAHTQGTGERYLAAFEELGGAVDALRAALSGGDPDGVVAATRRMSEGIGRYGQVRREIGQLVEQALLMRRMFVK